MPSFNEFKMENYTINKVYLEKKFQFTFYSILLSIILIILIANIFNNAIPNVVIPFIPLAFIIIFIIPAIIYDRQYSSIDMVLEENKIEFIKKNKIILIILLNEIIKVKEIEIPISRILRWPAAYSWYLLRFYNNKIYILILVKSLLKSMKI